MIKQTQIIVEFNGGDIAVGGRATKGLGEIVFESLKETQEIGTVLGESDKNAVYPVKMVFKNTKSIDVVIKMLEKVKLEMLTKERTSNAR